MNLRGNVQLTSCFKKFAAQAAEFFIPLYVRPWTLYDNYLYWRQLYSNWTIFRCVCTHTSASMASVNNAKASRIGSYFLREDMESRSGKTEFNIRERVDVEIGAARQLTRACCANFFGCSPKSISSDIQTVDLLFHLSFLKLRFPNCYPKSSNIIPTYLWLFFYAFLLNSVFHGFGIAAIVWYGIIILDHYLQFHTI